MIPNPNHDKPLQKNLQECKYNVLKFRIFCKLVDFLILTQLETSLAISDGLGGVKILVVKRVEFRCIDPASLKFWILLLNLFTNLCYCIDMFLYFFVTHFTSQFMSGFVILKFFSYLLHRVYCYHEHF